MERSKLCYYAVGFFLCELPIDLKNDPLITVKNLSVSAFLLLKREGLMSATNNELILQQIKRPSDQITGSRGVAAPYWRGSVC